ncbi:histidine kinase [Flavobacterium sp. MAH-1]|uniref:Histidine kinase n=1 Tax=Flavobacterium agri TaxID=2743471 RepID=A0A7Y9C4Y5_9FLAO|nr:histidine kinase [Flavobacterium agri]NUY80370.1 histidine kinase [Flavobacterium agri]NYA70395.1 histidine kinase [Flavobacterium agri]
MINFSLKVVINSQPEYVYIWSFVASMLFILTALCALIYSQSRVKSFLYYGLYNFVTLTYLFPKSPFLFHLDDVYVTSRFYGYSLYSQILFHCLLFFFYREFLDLKQHRPKFHTVLTKVLYTLMAVGGVLFVLSIAIGDLKILHVYYMFFHLPVITGFSIYALYSAFFIPNRLGYFIIVGVTAYNILAYTAFYRTLFLPYETPAPLVFFCTGIIFESVVFMLGLGYKIRLLYLEKINSQQKIIQEQAEIQRLKENYQVELETKLHEQADELKSVLQKSEDEKLKSLTLSFENEISLLRLESLRSQMNPHFIFNALNSIKVYLIDNDKEQAVYYLNKFSKLIRKILESSRTDSISLEEELEIIELYMNIENIRFDKKINFAIDVDPNINPASIRLPGLILQPFIENALWHGLMLREGEKNIGIDIKKEDVKIVLSITDNGIGREKAKQNSDKKSFRKESLGLRFASERIANFNKKQRTDYSFEIVDLKDLKGNASGTKILFYFN